MENPLEGAFNRERTVLVFRQRSLERYAAAFATYMGTTMFLIGLLNMAFGWPNVPLSWWFALFGFLFALAGLWAYLSFRWIKFDLRKRTYTERYGSGALIRWRKGSIDEINGLGVETYVGLLPEPAKNALGQWQVAGGGIGITPGGVYALRLWWKDSTRFPPVIEHLSAGVTFQGTDARVGNFMAKAQYYAQALGVPLYQR